MSKWDKPPPCDGDGYYHKRLKDRRKEMTKPIQTKEYLHELIATTTYLSTRTATQRGFATHHIEALVEKLWPHIEAAQNAEWDRVEEAARQIKESVQENEQREANSIAEMQDKVYEDKVPVELKSMEEVWETYMKFVRVGESKSFAIKKAVEKYVDNARAYQRVKDAKTCKDMAHNEYVLSCDGTNMSHLERYASRYLEQAAKVIEDSK